MTSPILPSTYRRVQANTPDAINAANQQQIETNVTLCAAAGKDAISARLYELKHEWDMERVLEANAAVVMLTGIVLGFTVNRRWFAFSGMAAAFLLQHALQGWCPPVLPWRMAGIRTQAEIEEERTALRVLRGDFTPTNDPVEALAETRAE